MSRLDSRDKFPSGMETYLQMYQWTFSPKLAKWAVSKMMKTDPQTKAKKPIEAWTKEQVDEMLKRYGITLEHDNGYDAMWCANMAKADYYKSSIVDEQHIAMFVRDFIDDPDGYEGKCLTTFYASCIGKGVVVPWEDVI